MTDIRTLTTTRYKCDRCSAPDAILYQHLKGESLFFCSACIVEAATFEAAYDHLKTLLETSAAEWLAVWQSTGVEVELEDYFSLIASDIEDKYRAGQPLTRIQHG